MGLIISIANRKGGVGKTTLAIALAETFVFEHRLNTLIVDLDPQSSASEALTSEAEYADHLESCRALPHFFQTVLGEDGPRLNRVSIPARHSLTGRATVDLVLAPNSPELWDVEYDALRTGKEKEFRQLVARTFEVWSKQFDIIIVDCPPGKMMAAEEAIVASQVVLCPIVPERLSVWGMDKMRNYFEELGKTRRVPPWRFIISRWARNTREGDQQIEIIRTMYQQHFLTENQGFLGLGGVQLVGLPRSQALVTRIARFRIAPDEVRTLQQFYGADVTQELRRIANNVRGLQGHA